MNFKLYLIDYFILIELFPLNKTYLAETLQIFSIMPN